MSGRGCILAGMKSLIKNEKLSRPPWERILRIHEEDDYEVVIEFKVWAMDLLKGRQWHPSQVFIEMPGGGSRLTMRLSGLEEIEQWVLSWGARATVLAPRELVKRIRKIGEEIVARYAVLPDGQPG